ncbi:MAG: AMP-binding protein, partial [Planctomycetota bacterium]|nr:AMP-binding protein [Planctomycetota bacterium]
LIKARVEGLVLIPSFRSSKYVEMVRLLVPELDREGPIESAGLPDLRWVAVVDPDAPDDTTRPAPGFLVWNDLLDAGRDLGEDALARRAERLDADDPVNIQFTSGTTGAPKAVVLTHHGILNNALAIGEVMKFTAEDRLCVPVPFYHCFGMVVSNLASLVHGATIVIPSPHFEAGAVLHAIARERCTAVHGVPTMFVAELERPDFDDYDLGSLRTGIMAGAPCPPELVRQVIDRMGCREILVAYGMTEASPVTHCTRSDDDFDKRVLTVGTNLPHQEVKIVDPETGAKVPIGAKGEVCFRGYHRMREYLGDEAATRETIDEAGWLHSGDIGVLAADGYLSITGRLKNMIIRGGENIYPAEIESALYRHECVADAAVFGVPDARMGEEIAAWIRLREGAETSADDLRAFAKDALAHFKIPRYIWFVDDFPMTVSGKIQKFRLREQTQQWLLAGDPPPA